MLASNASSHAPMVVIGAQKSGTATLSEDIARCAGFEIDLVRKEESMLLEYDGSDRLARKISHFFTPEKRGCVVVDVSTLYTTAPANTVPVDKVIELMPDLKIVYILREPLARALSHHRQDTLIGLTKAAADDALKSDSTFVENSLYGKQLLLWSRYVPAQNIHLIKFEDYIANRVETVRNLCEFAGVDSSGCERIDSDKAFNVTGARPKFHPWIHRILASKIYHQLVRKRVNSQFRNKLKKSVAKPNDSRESVISEDTQIFLAELFKSDYELLKSIYPDAPQWT